MHMERGPFGGDALPDGSLSEIFEARVVIPQSEFKHLELGGHERPTALPACFRWCYANLGAGGRRWSVMLREDTAALLYFANAHEALAFLGRWSAGSGSTSHLALAS